MKVLQKGRPQTGFAAELKCTGAGNGFGGCGALLLVEQDDFYQHTQHDYGGGSEFYVLFRCSECGVWTDVDTAKVRVPNQRALKTYGSYGKETSGEK